MKKLILLFILCTNALFSQEKQVFDTVTYSELISFYNEKLNLKNETLDQNIERCKYILADNEKKDNVEAVVAFKIILKGLTEAKSTDNKETAFITVYKDSAYNFYDSQNKFIGRVYPEKFKETKDTEALLKEYFFLVQE